MVNAAFEIAETRRGDWARLSVAGDLDAATAPLLTRRVQALRAAKTNVSVDLSRTEFIDCAGLTHGFANFVDLVSAARVAFNDAMSRLTRILQSGCCAYRDRSNARTHRFRSNRARGCGGNTPRCGRTRFRLHDRE